MADVGGNVLRLQNRFGDCVLSFETDEEMTAWQRALGELIDEMSSSTSAAITEASPKLGNKMAV
jgi:hypothetical protein